VLQPSWILRTLRGAEPPLFHDAACISVQHAFFKFFRLVGKLRSRYEVVD
jgi:hypothetical protein